MAAYMNTMARYAAVKEEEAQKCKDELLVLWTDFFKPQHLESIPDLHDTFWHAAKLCSACKVEVSADHAQELMDACESIHQMFSTPRDRCPLDSCILRVIDEPHPGCRIQGDSMWPTFRDGDVLMFTQQNLASLAGDVVLFPTRSSRGPYGEASAEDHKR